MFKFCPRCGTALITRMEAGRERQVCPACGYIVYRNPVPVALVLVEHEGKLLLLQRRHPPLANYWAPPAGYVEIDESLEEGAAREVREETGLRVSIDQLLKVHSRAHVGVFLIAFRASLLGGELSPAPDEVLEIKWFAPGEIPHQPPPTDGILMDTVFYEVLHSLYADLRKEK